MVASRIGTVVTLALSLGLDLFWVCFKGGGGSSLPQIITFGFSLSAPILGMFQRRRWYFFFGYEGVK